MRLDYHDLNEHQFEKLVLAVCSHLLGLGVQGFSKGPDGGKDARFHGRAERFPSSAAPWEGHMVIQAKHTDLINRKFSEPDFSGDAAGSILSEELPRIRRLREAGELDYYLLFSNRRLAGVAEERIRKRIADAAGIPEQAVHLCGVEALDQYLAWEPDILRRADINPFDALPFIDPADLARVIQALAREREHFAEALDGTTPPPERRVTLAEKNRINGLSAEYAAQVQRYIKEFKPVRTFLAAPDNGAYVRRYEDTVEELNGVVRAYRQERHDFDQVLERLFRLLVDRDYDLKANKHLTRTVLYYMYWNCDLGKDDDA